MPKISIRVVCVNGKDPRTQKNSKALVPDLQVEIVGGGGGGGEGEE